MAKTIKITIVEVFQEEKSVGFSPIVNKKMIIKNKNIVCFQTKSEAKKYGLNYKL